MFALVFCPSSRLTSPSTTNSFFLILVFSFIWLTQSETMQCVFCQPAWFTSCSERHRGSDVAWLTLVMMSNWNVLLAENPRWSRVSPQKQPAGVSVCLCSVCLCMCVFSFPCFLVFLCVFLPGNVSLTDWFPGQPCCMWSNWETVETEMKCVSFCCHWWPFPLLCV